MIRQGRLTIPNYGTYLWLVFLVLCCISAPLPRQTIQVGGASDSGRRGLDLPYLTGVWGSEPAEWDRSRVIPYRWTLPTWRSVWPAAGRGWFAAAITIDTSNWHTQTDRTVTLTDYRVRTSASSPGLRNYTYLVRGTGLTRTLDWSVSQVAQQGDRRALGVVLHAQSLTPLAGAWSPLAGVGVLISSIIGWAFARSSGNVFSPRAGLVPPTLWALCVVLAPEWLAVHAGALWVSTLVATAAAWGITLLLIPAADERAGWRWAIGVCIFSPLLALNSPFLVASDSAMHARMLFDVLRGNLYQIAELPCEAGAATVPYPPLVYLLAAPLAITTWDRNTAASILVNGGVVVHTAALVYLWRVAAPERRRDRATWLFLGLASCSLPFVQALHIGELTNAWGHALFLVAVASWYDRTATPVLRSVLFCAALCSHTGIALSLVLVYAVSLISDSIATRKLPWERIWVGLSAIVAAVIFVYSASLGLLVQPAKYPDCPPIIPLATRLLPVLTAVSPVLVLLGIIGALRLPTGQTRSLVVATYGAAVLSIAVLVVKTQTVRWAMAVVPFLALAAVIGSAHGVPRWQRRLLSGAGVLVIVLSYVALWERIYTYLH